MGNFRSSDRGGGFRSGGRSGGFGGGRSGGRGGFRDRDDGFERRRPEMHKVTCDKCKKECEVPFKPTGGKPVFCSDCFRSEDSGGRNSRGSSSPDLKEVNAKLDKILGILEMIEFEEDEESDAEEEAEEVEEAEETKVA